MVPISRSVSAIPLALTEAQSLDGGPMGAVALVEFARQLCHYSSPSVSNHTVFAPVWGLNSRWPHMVREYPGHCTIHET